MNNKKSISLFLFFSLLLSFSNLYASDDDVSVSFPSLVLQGVPFSINVETSLENPVLEVNGVSYSLENDEGKVSVESVTVSESNVDIRLITQSGQVAYLDKITSIPAYLSLAPPIIAIAIAIIFKQVIAALFIGIWAGAALTYGLSFSSIWKGLLDLVSKFTVESVNDWGHVAIIIFSLMIGGLVGIITKNGGTAGIVNLVVKRIRSRRDGQVGTALLGSSIFFDDYANTLIVGSTMRPITDKLKISREKLAYIVDSTAAPVASIVVVSTWVGIESGLISDAVEKIEGIGQSGYAIFLDSLAYSFYPILSWIFVLLIAYTGRDFGPMKKAELAALAMKQEPPVSDKAKEAVECESSHNEEVAARAYRAILPILFLLISTVAGIYYTGLENVAADASFVDAFTAGDSFLAMLWASLGAVMVAFILSLGPKGLSFEGAVEAWFEGVRTLTPGIIVLIMAWSMAGVNESLQTASYLSTLLNSLASPEWFPAIVFILASFTAFSTGTSWGVMSILIPLVVPLSWSILEANGMAGSSEGMAIFYASIASVMAGAVWGDHCSPISDTTILASISSDCDHVAHVKTQTPYAMFVGGISVLLGLIPAGFGMPIWLCYVMSLAVMYVGLKYLSKEPTENNLAYQTSRAEGL